MAQWARFGRLPVEFTLYVPSSVAPVARRLCGDHRIGVTEIWTFHMVGDQMRFTQVHRAPLAEKLAAARAAAAEARRASAREEELRKAPAARAKARPTRAAEKPAAKAARQAPRGEARRQSRAQTRGGQEAVSAAAAFRASSKLKGGQSWPGRRSAGRAAPGCGRMTSEVQP